MAVKKKKFDDAPVSKTARASAAKGKKKDEAFVASGDADRLISLNSGQHAYVLSSDGKTHHVLVGSEKWTSLTEALLADPKFGWKVQAQLESWNGAN